MVTATCLTKHNEVNMTAPKTAVQAKRYLLIDDDATYRAIMVRCAQMAGMELEAYESLADLGSVGLLGRFDTAIVDYNLDQMTGVEIADYLDHLFTDVPMVLVSSAEQLPDGRPWPQSIKMFVKKSRGYTFVLEQAKRCASGWSKASPGLS